MKILVKAPNRIGDLVLLTPMLRALRMQRPQAHIQVLASRHNHLVLRHLPHVDRVHVYSKKPADAVALMLKLRRERFDLWIDPKDHHSTESRLLVHLAGATSSVGYNGTDRLRHFDYSAPCQEEQDGVHAAQRGLNVLAAIGLNNIASVRPELGCDRDACAALYAFLAARGIDRYQLCQISANRAFRTWPAQCWVEYMQAQTGPILVCAAPADAGIARRIAATRPNAVYYPTRSILDAMAVVQRAATVVTVDTSVVHIASAYDRPLVALYANDARQIAKYAPLGTHARIVHAAEEKSPVAAIAVNAVQGAAGSLAAALLEATRPPADTPQRRRAGPSMISGKLFTGGTGARLKFSSGSRRPDAHPLPGR